MDFEYISLGGFCSIAYQLQKYNLRKIAYPFDWIRCDFTNLCEILENSFEGFMDDLTLINQSNCFPISLDDNFPDNIDTNSDILIYKNKYNCKFYHDFNSDTIMEDVINKYQNRIKRFYELITNKHIIFIRDELKVNQINLGRLIKTLNKLCPSYHLILITDTKINNSFDNVYNYTSKYIDWKRNNINWNQIFYGRNKLVVNINEDITEYNDNITDIQLIETINKLIKLINIDNRKYFNYIELKKSFTNNQIGVKYVMNKKYNDINILPIIDVHILCYQLNHGDNQIYYLTKNKYFKDIYENNVKWYHQITSFTQSSNYLILLIHKYVNQWIIKDKYNFIGLGGESGYYALYNKEYFNNITLLSSHQSIIEDYTYNCQVFAKIYKIDYNTFNFHEWQNLNDNNILLVNVSKNGLKNMINYVNNFKQIIYIGCNDKNKDLIILQNKYNIINSISSNGIYVYNLLNKI